VILIGLSLYQKPLSPIAAIFLPLWIGPIGASPLLPDNSGTTTGVETILLLFPLFGVNKIMMI